MAEETNKTEEVKEPASTASTQGGDIKTAENAEQGRGCFVDGSGWGQSGSLWVQ